MIPDRSALKETVRHGTAGFPLAVYKSHENHHPEILFSHWHDEVELMLLTSGDAVFQLDGESVRLSAGEAMIVNSGVLHAGISEMYRSCAFIAVVFDLNMLGGLMDAACREQILLPMLSHRVMMPVRFGPGADWGLDAHERIRNAAEGCLCKQPGAPLRLASGVLDLFGQAAENGLLHASPGADAGVDAQMLVRIKQAVQFIQERYDTRIGIDDMAEHLHLSRFHFSRFFRRMMGKTPLEYLTRYRIRMAESLLRDPSRKVMDVALDVGFENVSWFITCFRRVNGCTPAEYRRGQERLEGGTA